MKHVDSAPCHSSSSFAPIGNMCTLILLAIAMVMIVPAVGWGGEPVLAKYHRVSGDTVHLRIDVGNPSPSSLILEQYLPRGTRLVSSSPPARQTGDGRVVKWLFKNISTGAIDVRIQVAPASSARNVTGVVRYRMPEGGGMREIRVGR